MQTIDKDKFKNQLTKTIKAEEYKTMKLEQQKKMENINTMLDQANEMLFEEMKRLKELDVTKKSEAETEIQRGNALSNTSKTFLQTVGIQMTIQKNIGV